MIGPPGVRARPHPWWTPVRLLLALAVVSYALCVLVKTPCAQGGEDAGWWNTPADYANLCASDLPGAYLTTGLAEGVAPLSNSDGRFETPSASAPTAGLAYGAATLTRALHGWPDTDERASRSRESVAESSQVRAEAVTYVAVSAVVQLGALLIAIGCLAAVVARSSVDSEGGSGRGRGTFVRLAPFAASPLVVFAGLVGWYLVPVALVCGAIWAWSRGRALLCGALAGVGAAMSAWPAVLLVALVAVTVGRPGARAAVRSVGAGFVAWIAIVFPAFVLSGGNAGESVWSYVAGGARDGSVWKVVEAFGPAVPAHTLNLAVVGLWLVAGAAAVAYGALRAHPPPACALALALLVAVLVVGKGYEPGYALWLLPLAVIASRSWRDVLAWQGAELFFVFATWWHLGGYTDALDGGDPVYAVAVVVRVVAELWLAWRVLRVHSRPRAVGRSRAERPPERPTERPTERGAVDREGAELGGPDAQPSTSTRQCSPGARPSLASVVMRAASSSSASAT